MLARKPSTRYVVRSRESHKCYLMDSKYHVRGYNCSPKLRYARRGSLNRMKKLGRWVFRYEGFEVRKVVCFGLFAKTVYVQKGVYEP